jgi:signal transduction histidine kinase
VLLRRVSDRYEEASRRVDGLDDAVSGLVGASHAYLDYAAQAERRSTEQERTRITQELHDIVGQAFTNISAMMEASLKHPAAGAEEVHELHTWVKDQAHHGLSETRAILYELRSIREPELSGIQAINNLVATFERSTRVKVKVEWGNLPWEVGPALDAVLYKLIQESLINAFRHGHATEITVHFWVDDQSLIVDVNDNGRGGAGGKKGIGQEGMEQRAGAIGGNVTFAGTVHGYQVHAVFPRRLMERV